jgi:hypothetical protein
MPKQPREHSIRVNFEGEEYSASYSVMSGAVTVESEYGAATAHVGGKAESTARMLLREILGGAKARGELGKGG